MEENNQILQGLNTALKGLGEMQKMLMKSLTPEQQVKYSKFQENYTTLQNAGDYVGAQKLQEQFKEEMK